MGGGKRETVLIAVVVVMGIMMLIEPIRAQENAVTPNCWDKILGCMGEHLNQSTSNPVFDKNSPSFNVTEFLCCSLIRDAIINDKPCFCLADTYIHQNAFNGEGEAALQILQLCGVFDPVASLDPLASLDAFCPGFAPQSTDVPVVPQHLGTFMHSTRTLGMLGK